MIFGVADTYTIKGLEQKDLKSQSDLLDFLSNCQFAGGLYPDISLHNLEFGSKTLQVLEIKDRNEKPYYVLKNKKEGKKTILAGCVYSRVNDKNTAKDTCASVEEISEMWRQRFGIHMPVKTRVLSMMRDPQSWDGNGESYWFHKVFPEFTIQNIEEPRKVTFNESWVREATNPEAYYTNFQVRFHQTLIMEQICILFDEMREFTPAPRINGSASPTHGEWYYYLDPEEDSFRFLNFFTKQTDQELITTGLRDGRCGPKLPVLIFKDSSERKLFENWLKLNPPEVRETDQKMWPQLGNERSPEDEVAIAFSRASMRRLDEFREIRVSGQ